ncbi:MAG: aminotransferase class I/II-fold pyridoxal phosphate-dependent enzyme [Pseudomonadota bacterium]
MADEPHQASATDLAAAPLASADAPTADASTAERARSALRAAQRSDIDPFIVMDVMRSAAAREAEGHKVIHLEVGQPSTKAPAAALARARSALDSDPLGYTLATGMPALRERIAQLYQDWYGVSVSPQRIVITNGSSAAFTLAFLAAFDVGDRVALPSPGYPCYRHILSALGQQPMALETDASTRWMPDIERLAQSHATSPLRGLLLASPNNPTGTMLSAERLQALITWCGHEGLWFISDEIYHGLHFDTAAQTALATSQDVIIINSFSKYFSMTGWRVGWMVVPEVLIRTVERLAQNLFICAPAISQHAALGAFDGIDELEANRAVYAANRSMLLERLPTLGFTDLVPSDGAFYLYADVSAFSDDALAFAQRMLHETGVAVTPGLDFDAARGHRFVRFSFARDTAHIAEGLDRLGDWDALKR